MQLTFGPYVLHIWTRNTPKFGPNDSGVTTVPSLFQALHNCQIACKQVGSARIDLPTRVPPGLIAPSHTLDFEGFVATKFGGLRD